MDFNELKKSFILFLKFFDTDSIEHKELLIKFLRYYTKNMALPFLDWGRPKLFQSVELFVEYGLDYYVQCWVSMVSLTLYIPNYACQFVDIFMAIEWQAFIVFQIYYLLFFDLHNATYCFVIFMVPRLVYNYLKKKSITKIL